MLQSQIFNILIATMNNDQFRTIGLNHVESARGFSIQRNDRNSLLYSRAGFTLEIEVEPGEALCAYLTHSPKIKGVCDQEIQVIRNDLVDALRFMKIKFEIN